jgi:murein DD-endopeptidase MepM/ murein hydrolase activator NlpD
VKAFPLVVGGASTLLVAPVMLALVVAGGAVAEEETACAPISRVVGLDEEQTRIAGVIVASGRNAGASSFGLTVALAAAYQESTLRNLPYGDRDSLGLFQQRPSTGWGTAEQVQDPVYAAGAFFGGPTGPNSTGAVSEPRGLVDIDGWQTMALTEAADAVQRSALPTAYARWEDDARAWLGELHTAQGGTCVPGGGLMCPPTGLAAEAGLRPDALRVLRCIRQNFPTVGPFAGVGDRPNDSDHPSGRAVDAMIPDWAAVTGNDLGWQVADWVRTNAACLGVTYVIFDAVIWSVAADAAGWRPYTHPGGGTDANSVHLNHVHVSVEGSGGACADGAWARPLQGSYTISARFSDVGESWATVHTGTDLAAPVGREVLAASAGQVTYAAWDGRYGQRVEITHADGTRSWYAHLSAITVTVRAQVTVGEVIGRLGSTGNSTGPHLHFEIRPASHGAPVDPEPWMSVRGAPLRPRRLCSVPALSTGDGRRALRSRLDRR